MELIEEIDRTILKPKFKPYFGINGLDEMLSVFEPFIDLIDVISIISICRDPKDNFLLSLAKDGKADFLLTGDKDLLDLKKIGKTKIATIASFLESMKISS